MLSRMAGFTSRYANALFELADEAGEVDAVAKDMVALEKLINESADLARLVVSPAIGRDVQSRAMLAVLDEAGAHPLVRRFVGVIAENGRLFALKSIIRQFLSDIAFRRGEIAAEVTSAIALDTAMEDDIRGIVSGIAGSDKVSLTTRVDASLLGGLVVRVGSRMIDSSIRSKLNRLELTMKGA